MRSPRCPPVSTRRGHRNILPARAHTGGGASRTRSAQANGKRQDDQRLNAMAETTTTTTTTATPSPTIRTFQVFPDIPPALDPLLELARNLWWVWHPDAVELFRRLD